MEGVDQPWELGDLYGMFAWTRTLIGDYENAVTHGSRSLELMQMGAEGVGIHGLCWCALAEFQMGNWSRVVDELAPTVDRYLGERGEDPPYFTQTLIGSAAMIQEARGDPGAERHVANLRRLAAGQAHHGIQGVQTWLAWIMFRRGRLDEAGELLDDADATGGHLPLLRQIQADFLVETGRWDRVSAFVEDARHYADRAGLRALPVQLDRLEGRAALASGDLEGAVELLRRAESGFAALHARWERARTVLFLAEGLADAGRRAEAGEWLADAIDVFEELGSLAERERAGVLAARLG
jgi:tetratricopeptide (TPR) repeat protein